MAWQIMNLICKVTQNTNKQTILSHKTFKYASVDSAIRTKEQIRLHAKNNSNLICSFVLTSKKRPIISPVRSKSSSYLSNLLCRFYQHHTIQNRLAELINTASGSNGQSVGRDAELINQQVFDNLCTFPTQSLIDSRRTG